MRRDELGVERVPIGAADPVLLRADAVVVRFIGEQRSVEIDDVVDSDPTAVAEPIGRRAHGGHIVGNALRLRRHTVDVLLLRELGDRDAPSCWGDPLDLRRGDRLRPDEEARDADQVTVRILPLESTHRGLGVGEQHLELGIEGERPADETIWRVPLVRARTAIGWTQPFARRLPECSVQGAHVSTPNRVTKSDLPNFNHLKLA